MPGRSRLRHGNRSDEPPLDVTPEEFEKLDPADQAAAIEKHNDTVRMWVIRCRKCGFKNIGTLAELRGKPCGACSNG
jgi:hypothetical protein